MVCNGKTNHPIEKGLLKTVMLFAGWEDRIVKNCDLGLKNAAQGRRKHFQAPGHSFSPYGPTLRRQITCLFISFSFFFLFACTKLVLQIRNGFVYATLVIQ